MKKNKKVSKLSKVNKTQKETSHPQEHGKTKNDKNK